MDTETNQVMFALVRSAVCGDLLSDEEKSLYHTDLLSQMLKTAKKHDIAHLVAIGLQKNHLADDSVQQMEMEIFQAVYRYEQLNFELNRLCETLEKAKIPFLPLKGSVLRQYYPEPWMRTSCDIDVLVHSEDLDRAIAVLSDDLEYKSGCKNSHDVSMFTRTGRHIELHYDLVEDSILSSASKVIKRVWKTATLHKNYEYWHDMSDELFYFYHIAHIAKHFQNGGCGIRPFVDIWVLNHKMSFDKKRRLRMLERGALSTFGQQAELLSEIWFGHVQHTDITKQMQDYILRGGAYGTHENHIAVQQQKQGGRIRYALSRFFIPYDALKFYYPVLQKHRCLTPIMQVSRWCKLIFGGHVRRISKELRYNHNLSSTDANNMQIFLKNIGL